MVETIQSPFIKALYNNEIDKCEVFLKNGYNPNNVVGECPIITLSPALHNRDMMFLLLKYGANPEQRNPTTSRSPLEYAILRQDIDLIKALINKGANPISQNKHNEMAIDIAYKTKNEDIIKLVQDRHNRSIFNTLSNKAIEPDTPSNEVFPVLKKRPTSPEILKK